MTIKFPKEEEGFSPQDAHIAYKHLVDYHLHFLKLQSKCEFFYWKLMGVFFLSIMGSFILRDKGIIADPLIAITFVGFGCLLVFTQNVRMDLEYAVSAASCVEKGLLIESKYNYPARLFRIFEDNKNLTYRGHLLSRVVPFSFIGLSTIIASSVLAEKIGMWLAVTVAIAFMVGLVSFAKFYVKASKRAILGAEA
jgi:hypothetical protein